MNFPESQPESEPAAQYFDPEPMDTSEQQFAVSLDEKLETPRFVVESVDIDSSNAENRPELQTRHASGEKCESELSQIDAMEANAHTTDCKINEETEPSHAGEPGAGGENTEPDWRNLVSAKVNNYRSRRPYKERYPSLQLPFDADSRQQKPDIRERFALSCDEFDMPPAPAVQSHASELPVLMESTARVLEFPRPVAVPTRSDELAEPVTDRLRILEAPELVPPPPAMGGILIEPEQEPEPQHHPGFDVPLQTAPLERRLLAAGLDALIVGCAVAVFGSVALRMIGSAVSLRAELEVLAVLLAIVWPAYQYAFLVHCGITPGLRLAQLQVQRFEGRPVPRALRRWRVFASLLSAASLGLGYFWCFLDEDQLTWHDRITRTHLVR